MNKILIALTVLIFYSLISSGQSKNYFYATVDDFKNNKRMLGYEIQEGSWDAWTNSFGKETVIIKTSSDSKRTRVSKCPSELLTYNNYFLRAFDDKLWFILADGKYCYYSQFSANQYQAVSEGIEEKLEKFKDAKMEALMQDYGLLSEYKEDKPVRDKNESDNEYFNRIIQWNIKYFKILNGKTK
jgi:hypothetical protein